MVNTNYASLKMTLCKRKLEAAPTQRSLYVQVCKEHLAPFHSSCYCFSCMQTQRYLEFARLFTCWGGWSRVFLITWKIFGFGSSEMRTKKCYISVLSVWAMSTITGTKLQCMPWVKTAKPSPGWLLTGDHRICVRLNKGNALCICMYDEHLKKDCVETKNDS